MYTKFVQVGRVVLVEDKKRNKKLAVIVDILDHNRALIDCPSTGIDRQIISFKRLSLTKYTMALPRGARSKTVRKVFEESGVLKKWEESSAGQKMIKASIRQNLSDFDRHKVMLHKMKVLLALSLLHH